MLDVAIEIPVFMTNCGYCLNSLHSPKSGMIFSNSENSLCSIDMFVADHSSILSFGFILFHTLSLYGCSSQFTQANIRYTAIFNTLHIHIGRWNENKTTTNFAYSFFLNLLTNIWQRHILNKTISIHSPNWLRFFQSSKVIKTTIVWCTQKFPKFYINSFFQPPNSFRKANRSWKITMVFLKRFFYSDFAFMMPAFLIAAFLKSKWNQASDLLCEILFIWLQIPSNIHNIQEKKLTCCNKYHL